MAKKKSVDAYVLPQDAAAGAEPVVFPGFPGRFTGGVAVEVTALSAASGLSGDELDGLVDELELPLERVAVAAGSAPVEWPDGHVISEATVEFDGENAPEAEAGADAQDAADDATVEEPA